MSTVPEIGPSRRSVEGSRRGLIVQLRELIAALERRIPCLAHAAEERVAHDSAALKKQAQARIAQLQGMSGR